MSEQTRLILCPYCGCTQAHADRCAECGGLFEPLSRRATQIAMGPWFIRDKQNPFRPGCSYEVLKKQVRSGRIKPHTVMRGPTTRQFWSVARHVPGVAHLLGSCHACGAKVSPDEPSCPECEVAFDDVKERNELGLAFRTNKDAQRAQRLLDREIAGDTGRSAAPAAQAEDDGGSDEDFVTPPTIGQDLLAEVLGGASPDVPRAPHAAPTAPAAAPMTPQALDFSPSETAASPRPRSQPRRISPLTLLIVALNVLVLVGVVVVAIKVFTGTDALSRQSRQLRPHDAGDASEDTDGNGPRSDSGADAIPPRHSTRTAPRSNADPQSSLDDEDFGGNGDDTPTATVNDEKQPDAATLAAAITKVQTLEKAGDLAGALQAVQVLIDDTPAARRPAELDVLHRRLMDKLAREQADTF